MDQARLFEPRISRRDGLKDRADQRHLGEIGDGYLAVSEIYRRIGTSAFGGRRPSMPQFETWVKWAEWLGGIEKIVVRVQAPGRRPTERTFVAPSDGKFVRALLAVLGDAPSRISLEASGAAPPPDARLKKLLDGR